MSVNNTFFLLDFKIVQITIKYGIKLQEIIYKLSRHIGLYVDIKILTSF